MYDIIASDDFQVDYLKPQGPSKLKLLVIFSVQRIILI